MTTTTLASPTEFAFSGDLFDIAGPAPATIERTSVTTAEHCTSLQTKTTNLPMVGRLTPPTSVRKDQDDVGGIIALVMVLLLGASAVAFTGLMAANFYSSMLRFSPFDIVRMLGM